MKDVEPEVFARAVIIVTAINSALMRGVKHYRKSDNKLLTNPLDIIRAFREEKTLVFDPPEGSWIREGEECFTEEKK